MWSMPKTYLRTPANSRMGKSAPREADGASCTGPLVQLTKAACRVRAIALLGGKPPSPPSTLETRFHRRRGRQPIVLRGGWETARTHESTGKDSHPSDQQPLGRLKQAQLPPPRHSDPHTPDEPAASRRKIFGTTTSSGATTSSSGPLRSHGRPITAPPLLNNPPALSLSRITVHRTGRIQLPIVRPSPTRALNAHDANLRTSVRPPGRSHREQNPAPATTNQALEPT